MEQKETTERDKRKDKSKVIKIEADYKEVALNTKGRLIADGMDEAEAESRINKVWSLFKSREYRYREWEDWHILTSPADYLAGALYEMAKHQLGYNLKSREECHAQSLRDGETIRALNHNMPDFRNGCGYIDKDVDFALGRIEEAQNRIRYYLDHYPINPPNKKETPK